MSQLPCDQTPDFPVHAENVNELVLCRIIISFLSLSPRRASPAPEPSRQESHRRRSGANGSAAGPGESRIANFFRSIFRRNNNSTNSQRSDTAAENNSATAAGDDATGRGGPVGEVHGGVASTWRVEGGGGGPLAAVGTIGANGAGTEGLANFAMRDLINFLNPAFAAPNAAESMVSFERALAWSVGGSMAATIGGGSGGGSGGRVRGRRRLQLPSAEEAREELQFNGLLLAPHQVRVQQWGRCLCIRGGLQVVLLVFARY